MNVLRLLIIATVISSYHAWTPAVSRRDALRSTAAASLATITPFPAIAITDSTTTTSPLVQRLMQATRRIPTFCIVNPTNGASYMVYQRDLAVGYAFLTFEGAYAVLKDAQKTAQEGGYFELWENAVITTIPLDAAIRLSFRKRPRLTPKEQSLDSILRVIPGAVRRQCIAFSFCFELMSFLLC